MQGTMPFLSIFLFLLVACQTTLAQSYVITGNNWPASIPGSSIKMLRDTTKSLQFEQLPPAANLKFWKTPEKESINLGYTSDVVWAHFELTNQSDREDLILEINYSLLDSLDFYYSQAEGSIASINTGRSLPFASRGELQQPDFAFVLNLPPGATRSYWLRIHSTGPVILPIKVVNRETYVQNQFSSHLYYGIYFGWLAVMIFYNLFIFGFLRDLNYFYYVLTIVCTLGIFATVSGYSYMYIFPDYPWINTYFTRIFMGFVVITTAIFARNFLNTKKYARWGDWVLLGLIAMAVVAQILVVTGIRISATNTVVSIHTVMLIATGVACWRNGNSYARFFVLAWTLYLIGGLLITLRNAGVLPINFWTTHGAEIGSALEVIILSLALSDRYRTIRKEKEALTKETLRMQKEYSEELEDKVQERTSQLSEANEELNQVNEELSATIDTVQLQKSEIEQQRDGLEKQQLELEKAYQNIRSSIAYAERIQKAKLPELAQIKKAFPESFVLFKPRDQVSGDFYWFTEKDDKKIIAAVDCTGHGVPGAFMSLIGSELLYEIVTMLGITSPGEILQLLHEGVNTKLRQDATENRDGMDLAVCVVDTNRQEVQFAGAKNPLVYIENGELKQIKGDKISVGGRRLKTAGQQFTTHTLSLKQTTSFYIFSDGFQDQFGGPEGRKFMIKRLKELLLGISHLPMEEQHMRLDFELDQWQNWPGQRPERQMDDILLIGFRMKAREQVSVKV